MRRAGESGFTLLELVLALALLATMLALAWSGLSFALRAWDAGEANGRRTADLRLSQNFLRRELAEIFPMRWKDAFAVKLAFEADAKHLRFVSSRPAGISSGGLALVGLELESAAAGRSGNLVMRRALPDDEAKDFAPLERGERTLLVPGVETVAFDYFGAENDMIEPRWVNEWTFASRVPQLVRLRVKMADGSQLPDFVVRVMLGEEAGCLENSFQRNCRPRRP